MAPSCGPHHQPITLPAPRPSAADPSLFCVPLELRPTPYLPLLARSSRIPLIIDTIRFCLIQPPATPHQSHYHHITIQPHKSSLYLMYPSYKSHIPQQSKTQDTTFNLHNLSLASPLLPPSPTSSPVTLSISLRNRGGHYSLSHEPWHHSDEEGGN